MAKRTKRLLAMCMVLIFSIGMIASPAMAASDYYEWYQVIVNGSTVTSQSGPANNHGWLVSGVYRYNVSISGTTMYWTIGNQSGSADVSNYIYIPDGYEVAEGGYSVTSTSVEGVNSQAANYDNAIVTVTINALYDPITKETIPVTEPTAPETSTEAETTTEPEESKPVQTAVTVNHNYYTYDAYTGETTLDGTDSASTAATEGDSFTAQAVPYYGGNEYVQQSSNLTITVQADASANVINIDYLRSIDTTPVPVETAVTVNHKYYTYDAYTGNTTFDGETSGSEAATEGETYTAGAVLTYGGNAYQQSNVSPAMTITVAADAAENVISIDYLRSIDTTPINYTPVLSIAKTADKAVYESGETITWTITVTNTSEHTAYNVAIVDELTGDSWTVPALAAGEAKSFTATTKNAAAGSIKNVAVATWEDGDEIPDGEEPNEIKTVSDDEIALVNDPAPENYIPVLSVTKTAGKEVYKEGETASWTITVKNVSEYTAYDVVIVDKLVGGNWTIASLAPGAEQSFTASLENVAAGTLKNIAVVTWDDGDEIPDEEEENEVKTVTAEEIVPVEELENFKPMVTVVKSADKAVYELGETITWTITVKNIGEHTAYDVQVADEMTGDHWSIESLAPGEEKSFTITLAAEAEGTIRNVAVVSWDDGDEIPDEKEPDEVKENTAEETVTVDEPEPPAPPAPPAPQNEDEDEEPEEEYIPMLLDDEFEIPDEEVPLADVPKEIEILDEEVPLADVPETGDLSLLWAAMSVASAGGIAALRGKKSKKEDEE